MTWLAILGFFRRIPRGVWIVLAIAALLGFGAWRHQAAVKAAYRVAYSDGVAATTRAFRNAQAKADAIQRAKITKQAKEAGKISQDSSHALQDRNVSIDARADAIRVRHEAADRKRASRPGNVPAAPSPAAGVEQVAACDRLSWDATFNVLIQAEKNQAQLIAILEWEAKQQALSDAANPPEQPK